MAGSNHYNINHSIELVKYLKNNPIKITIAPVWVPGINDNEISKIIKFAKENKVEIGIQNYLYYKNGRKPAKQKSWDEFYSELKEYEKEYKIKLILGPDDFKIKKCKQLKNPFKKDEILKLDIISPGRFINEKLAVSRGRVVSVINCKKDKGTVKAKIIRTKHNIIVATML